MRGAGGGTALSRQLEELPEKGRGGGSGIREMWLPTQLKYRQAMLPEILGLHLRRI